MLELIVKGLILWVYDMILECVGRSCSAILRFRRCAP